MKSLNEKYTKDARRMNWSVFRLLVISGGIATAVTIVDLMKGPSDSLDGDQSYIGFNWEFHDTVMSLTLAILTVLLAAYWKRLFPFNMALAIILSGFFYQLFFFIFTVGWDGFQGLVGLIVSVFAGLFLFIWQGVLLFKQWKGLKVKE